MSESVKLVGGLVVVSVGLVVLLVLGLVGMELVGNSGSNVVAIATSAFGVIGTVVGAYFGVKIGTDGTQTAVAGLKDEAAKAQAFAAHVPAGDAQAALAAAQRLATSGQMSRPQAAGR